MEIKSNEEIMNNINDTKITRTSIQSSERLPDLSKLQNQEDIMKLIFQYALPGMNLKERLNILCSSKRFSIWAKSIDPTLHFYNLLHGKTVTYIPNDIQFKTYNYYMTDKFLKQADLKNLLNSDAIINCKNESFDLLTNECLGLLPFDSSLINENKGKIFEKFLEKRNLLIEKLSKINYEIDLLDQEKEAVEAGEAIIAFLQNYPEIIWTENAKEIDTLLQYTNYLQKVFVNSPIGSGHYKPNNNGEEKIISLSFQALLLIRSALDEASQGKVTFDFNLSYFIFNELMLIGRNYKLVEIDKTIEKLKKSKGFIYYIIKKNWGILLAVPQFRSDKELMLEMIKTAKKRIDICYISEKLKDDKDIALAVLNKDFNYYSILTSISENLQLNHREVVLELIKKCPHHYQSISENLKNDKKICLEALKKSTIIYPSFPEKMRQDKEFVLEAVKINRQVVDYISVDLQKDEDILSVINRS